MMKITKIKISNYRPYFGVQTIEIPQTGKIIVVKGENGAGKTSFLNGLTWCLYHEKSDYEDVFNDKALNEIQLNNTGVMFIEIHFNHDFKNHILNRTIIAEKLSDSKYDFKETYTLETIKDGKITPIGDFLHIENYINNILNESVKNYFFFDGARIETFTRDDHNKDVEKAIKNLLKIETIIKAREHITTIKNEIRSSIKEKDGDQILKSLEQEISNQETELTFKREDLENLKKEISAVEKDIEHTINEIDHIERNSNIKERKAEYEKRREEKKDKLRQCNDQIDELIKKCFLCFADNLIEDASALVKNKAGQTGISPSAIKLIIKETIESNKCYICDSPLSPNQKETLLSIKLPKIASEKVADFSLLEMSNDFTTVLKEGQQAYNNITQLKNRINEYRSEITDCEEVIKQCEAKIVDELPGIVEHKEMIKKLQGKKTELTQSKITLENDINSLEKSKKKNEEKHLELTKQNQKFKQESRMLEIAGKISNELDSIFNAYEEVEIEKINQITKEIFERIIRKEDVYKKIFVDHEYKLNVNREFSNKNILKQLSYGERQLLSLSLILGLAKVSGDEGPFVMDTPMGNLDPIHRKKLMEVAPGLINQLFLLVTGSEFTEDLYKICYNEISANFKLVTQKNGLTEIHKEVQ